LKHSIKSVEKIHVFTKTQPKVTQADGGWVYEFSDVFALSRGQTVQASNIDEQELNSTLEKRHGLRLIEGKKKK